MKATELMFGDWYQYTDYTKTTKYSKVTRMQNGFEIIWDTYFHCTSQEQWITNPIPLTREILEKNGFVLNRWGEYENGAVRVIPATDNTMFSNIDHNVLSIHESGHLEVLHIRCDYVHTMQHALRLCEMNDMADNLMIL